MRLVVCLIALAACEPMPSTGRPLEPVRPAAPAPAPGPAPSAPVPSDDGSFDFGSDEGTDAPVSDVTDDPAALLAMSQGKAPPPPVPERPVPSPEPVLPAPSVGMPAPAPHQWDPASAAPSDWGVHLVSTLIDVQPPMAVLGLPDGQTVVVRPGTLLPERQLVVMAVGRDIVQVAKVVPDGYRARVETHTLGALYPPAHPSP